LKKFNIHQDIRKADTLPASFYRNTTAFEQVKENIFARFWQYAGDKSEIAESGKVKPFTLLPGVLNEPLFLSHDRKGQFHCLSNVCTHRGKILVEETGEKRRLSCRYHGRCFGLDGKFRSMPAFEETENFPSAADDLPAIALESFMNLFFVSLSPMVPFSEMIQPIKERLAWLPFDQMRHEPKANADYHVKANWALYIDNYLEGFHIPFVHPGLNQALELEKYDYEIFPYCNLQIGIANEGELCFHPPAGHIDHGKKVLAYYWWLFPNIMFNVYPWGVSFNSIEPLNHQETLVRFRSYYFPDSPYQEEEKILNQTELEDESVVESVQLGIQSRLYNSGRFSPSMEKGVHHFQSLIHRFMEK